MSKVIIIIVFLIIPLALKSQEIGKKAPDFTGKTFEGDKIKLSNYEGKITLIDVWASWCKPCKEEFPFLIELYNKYSDKDFTILAVNIDEEKQNAKKFLKGLNKEIPFTIIFDSEAKIPLLYKIEAIPTTYILDKKGIIRYFHLGFMESEKEKFKNEIETLINE